MKDILLMLLLCWVVTPCQASTPEPNLPTPEAYQLVFQDEFDANELDWTVWDSEDATKKSASGQRTYRGKENAILEDGLLKLMVRKKSINNSEWTAAFIWLKETYGANTYYETRFKNTNATGINNAFWMACKTTRPYPYQNRYEIDCPENKVRTDGSVYAHLAWHDWKTASYLGSKQHIAQGLQKWFPVSDFQTWGLWVGEKDFVIYCDGKEVWDGKTHKRYTDQYCSGVGKNPDWDPQEEQRAYGRYGQEDWCYFGGMNGDAMNVCFSTIPWETKGSPLTDRANGAFMAVDYLRIFKRKMDSNTTPVQQNDLVNQGESIALTEPIDLSTDGNTYISFVLDRQRGKDVSLSLRTDSRPLSSIRIKEENAIEIGSGTAIASTADSYPGKDRLHSFLNTGERYLVVVRITGQCIDKDIISCRLFDLNKPVPQTEPFLYHNIDAKGNTSITNEWHLSRKVDSVESITAVSLNTHDWRDVCTELKIADNYLAVVHPHQVQGHSD